MSRGFSVAAIKRLQSRAANQDYKVSALIKAAVRNDHHHIAEWLRETETETMSSAVVDSCGSLKMLECVIDHMGCTNKDITHAAISLGSDALQMLVDRGLEIDVGTSLWWAADPEVICDSLRWLHAYGIEVHILIPILNDISSIKVYKLMIELFPYDLEYITESSTYWTTYLKYHLGR